MPLYEYECGKCGEVFEVMQKFAEEPLTVHDKCGGPVQRLLSAPALQFKGSGWYITDYAKNNSSPGNDAPKKAGSNAASKSGSESTAAPASNGASSSEAKPQPASDTK